MTPDALEEKHDRGQLLLFFGLFFGFLGIVVDDLLEELGVGLPQALDLTLSAITLAGFGLFVVALIRLQRLVEVGDDGVFFTDLVRDERIKMLRLEAMTFGFISVLVLQMVLTIGTVALSKVGEVTLSAELGATVTFFVGLVASLGRFLYLNRVSDDG